MAIFNSYVSLPEGIQSRFGSADPTPPVWVPNRGHSRSMKPDCPSFWATAGMHERHEQDSKGREKKI